jgi:hypothetical protein
MANRRKRSTRSAISNSSSKTTSRESSSFSDEDAATSPVQRRTKTKKQRMPVGLSAQKFVWWISLVVLVISCLIGLGTSRIRQLKQQHLELVEQEQEQAKNEEQLQKKQALKSNNAPHPDKQPEPIALRLWKHVKKNLVQGLHGARPIAMAGQFAERGSSSASSSSDTRTDSSHKEVMVSVESYTDDTDPSNNSHEEPIIQVVRQQQQQQQKDDLAAEYANSFTSAPPLTDHQRSLLEQLGQAVHQEWPDLHQRAVNVAWGGPPDLTTMTSGGSYHWWNPVVPQAHEYDNLEQPASTSLDQIDGGYLLHAYLNIMKWPAQLQTHFPFGLCKAGDGCPSATAIGHSLEFREKYQPWMATVAVLKENAKGWIYARGFSPPANSDPTYGRHAVIWIRPGPVQDSAAYFRCILHAVDRSVAASLQQSSGRVGKFNVVMDGANYEWSCVPSLKYIKQAVIMLQDHFPDRLGMVFLVNVSMAGEILWRLVQPLLTKEVRDKVKILSSNPDQRMAELETMCEKEYIPDWLGGVDTYRFDAASYYPKSMQWSDEQGLAFMKSMPYHSLTRYSS